MDRCGRGKASRLRRQGVAGRDRHDQLFEGRPSTSAGSGVPPGQIAAVERDLAGLPGSTIGGNTESIQGVVEMLSR